MSSYKERFDRHSEPISITISEAQKLFNEYTSIDFNVEALQLLDGGFSNTNYRVQGICETSQKGQDLLLRLPQKHPELFAKEMAVLQLVGKTVPVPKVVSVCQNPSRPFAIMQYQKGDLLADVLENTNPQQLLPLLEMVGLTLGKIHSYKFEKSGFFDEEFNFIFEFENYAAAYIQHTVENLSKPIVKNRISSALKKSIIDLLENFRPQLESLKNCRTLTHADFNPKNIIVSGNQVVAILDWEFAFSGNPLDDIGNFVRFEEDYSTDQIKAFLSGYQQVAGELPGDWQAMAKVLDLASLSDFLTFSPQIAMPRSAQTAIRIIEKTISSV